MENITISPNQVIELQTKPDANLPQAISEAIEFTLKNDLEYATLKHGDYQFGIDVDSDIKSLLTDYAYYEDYKTLNQ